MSTFEEILTSSPEHVIDKFYSAGIKMSGTSSDHAARALRLTPGQLVCAVGFNQQVRDMLDLVFILGYDTLEDLLKERNKIFISDNYYELSLKKVFLIYEAFLSDSNTSQKLATKLLCKRVEMLEQKIENSVKPALIENYRHEMKTLYKSPNLPIEFVETRLENTASGYRALLDEVGLIVSSELIPAQELFLRNSVLPEEKRRLISKGLITNKLIITRLNFKEVSDQEREMLQNYLTYESN